MITFISSIILSIISGILVAIITVYYTFNESIRKDFNENIDLLFDEIDFNRKKLPLYQYYLDEKRTLWKEEKKLDWINHNEISVGYGGYLYNFFKFDAYNVFISKGFNLYLEDGIDYSLNEFFYSCKKFCANTQSIEDSMRVLKREGNYDSIDKCWNSIDDEYSKIKEIFEKYPQFGISKKNEYKHKWQFSNFKKRISNSNILRKVLYGRIVILVNKGELKEPFNVDEFLNACPDLEREKYREFVKIHSVKNKETKIQLFEQVKDERYRLIRPLNYGFK